jgi:hypothetical protein
VTHPERNLKIKYKKVAKMHSALILSRTMTMQTKISTKHRSTPERILWKFAAL